MTSSEIQYGAHWFMQSQMDSFYKSARSETGNPNIAREAGRFSASAKGLGAAKQYTLGLMNLTSICLLMGKLYPLLRRGEDVQTKKVGSNKVEIIVSPKPGEDEKPYQCDNRIGFFKAIAEFVNKEPAKVEHPAFFYKGDPHCHYVDTWERRPAHRWKKVRNYAVLLGMTATLALFFFLPTELSPLFGPMIGFLTISFACCCQYIGQKEFINALKSRIVPGENE